MSFDTVQVVNTLFKTSPVLIHAHGSHDHKPNWLPIRNAFFGSPKKNLGTDAALTVITCNNGHPSMGLLERSLDHLGIGFQVFGEGISPWENARDKPVVLYEALKTINTPYVLYADSRDAILIDDPGPALDLFRSGFKCRMLFGADKINWPPIARFQKYEDELAMNAVTPFRYLNGGAWLGETEFCRDFFRAVVETPPLEEAPESEQGILKKLLPLYGDDISLDYHCRIFQNIGFVAEPIFELREKQTIMTPGI